MTVTRRLFDITADEQVLEELLFAEGGEITPEAQALIDDHLRNLEGKSDQYAQLITEWKLGASNAKAMAKHFADRAKTHENAAAKLSERLVVALGMMDREKVVGQRFTVRRQKNPDSVELLVPVEELPDRWLRTKTIVEPDKNAMSLALKNQVADELMYADTPVAKLAAPTYSLRID